jgi:hypothetical protein
VAFSGSHKTGMSIFRHAAMLPVVRGAMVSKR